MNRAGPSEGSHPNVTGLYALASREAMSMPSKASGQLQVGPSDGELQFQLRIGVAGHRELPDPDAVAVADTVRERLVELRDRFRATSENQVSFRIYSSLAEGADQIVVHKAFGVFAPEDGTRVLPRQEMELRALLPGGPYSHRREFTPVTSASEFDELLRRAELPKHIAPVDDRAVSHEWAGRCVVDSSDLLLAVWDHRAPWHRGGTAEIVEYAREHDVPVFVIPVARRRGMAKAFKQRETRIGRWPAIDAYERIARFNRTTPPDDKIRQEGHRYRELLRGSSIVEQYDTLWKWAVPQFVRADLLANRYKRLHHWLGASLFIFLALAIATVAAQTEAGLSDRFAFLEAGLMLAALATLLISRRLHTLERWLWFRSLAEAFRGGLFIAMTGAKSPNEAQDARQPSAADDRWVQRAFSTAWRHRPHVKTEPSNAQDIQDFITEGWLKAEIKDHDKEAKRLHRQHGLLTAVVQLLLAGTVVSALIHAFEPLGESTPKELLFFLAIALPGFGAALTGIREQHQLNIHAQRSRRIAKRLRRLRNEIETPAGAHGGPGVGVTTIHNARRMALQIQHILRSEITQRSEMMEAEELEPAF